MRSTISDAIKNSLKIYNEIISIRKKLTAQMTYPLILIVFLLFSHYLRHLFSFQK